MRSPATRRRKVDSSSIASIGYAETSATLEVEFVRGALYRYFDVPRATFREFLAANSKGVFFNSSVRNRFRYERL